MWKTPKARRPLKALAMLDVGVEDGQAAGEFAAAVECGEVEDDEGEEA